MQLAGCEVNLARAGMWTSITLRALDDARWRAETRVQRHLDWGERPQGKLPVVAKVLLIEDEEATRLLIRVNLEGEGIELLEAGDGSMGIELARSAKPDLILLDVGLPVLDGWQVGRELKDDPSTYEIPLVFLSAHTRPDERERGLRIGAVDYITKPFDPTSLARRIRRILRAA